MALTRLWADCRQKQKNHEDVTNLQVSNEKSQAHPLDLCFLTLIDGYALPLSKGINVEHFRV
jgi:hypothetical protein